MMVSTRILSINSSYVHSQLEFTLFEIVTLVNVWCNRVMITITNGGKSVLLYFVTLSLFKYNFCKTQDQNLNFLYFQKYKICN